MSFYLLAIWIGFLGSIHCGLMCGPLILALPIDKDKMGSNFRAHLQYQFGRILTYALFGFVLGSFGQVLSQFAGHGQISLILGGALIAVSIFYFFSSRFRQLSAGLNLSSTPVFKFFSKFYGTPIWPFMAGVMNGLLPCGMVYLALATAINSHGAVDSAVFMFAFGLGTLPLLLSVALGGVYIKKYIQIDARKMLPYFALLLGVLLVFRSLHLGIPFLSPEDHLGYGTAVLCN